MNIRNEWCESSASGMDSLFYTKAETIADVQSNFDYRRYYSAEGHSVIIDGIIEQVIIQDHSNPINENKTDKKMLIPLNSVTVSGSYVTYQNETWLVISHVNVVDDAYKTCQIQKCNYTINIQSITDGSILSYPCIDESSSNIGIDENKVISTGSAIHHIKLPFDSETCNIKIDDRFFIDRNRNAKVPMVYKVTQVNNTEFNYGDKGLIELTLTQNQYNSETDSIEKWICNYYATPTPVPVGNTYSEIQINGDLVIGSGQRVLTCTLYNADKTINTTVEPVWNIVIPSGFGSYVKAEPDLTDKHKYYIEAVLDDNYTAITQIVTVNVSDGASGFVGKLDLEVKAM
jgi:hypothetical protein